VTSANSGRQRPSCPPSPAAKPRKEGSLNRPWLEEKLSPIGRKILAGGIGCRDAQRVVGAGARADAAFLDPPYNVRIGGHAVAAGSHREFAMASGEMGEAEFRAFLADTLGAAARLSRDGAVHFVCMDWRHMDSVSAVGSTVYGERLNLCITADKAFLLQLVKQGFEGNSAATRASLDMIEEAGRRRSASNLRIPVVALVAPGSVTPALEALRMAKKLNPYGETARIALEPWLVEAALARLRRRLSPADQRTVVNATRTPHKVRWPKWWSEQPQSKVCRRRASRPAYARQAQRQPRAKK
jgi:hypothetical protein